MKKENEILVLFLLFFADFARSDIFYNIVNREDPCIRLCEKTPLYFTNNEYVKSCCQRGCRFFNLVDLRYGLEPNSLNGTRDACEASCTEAYSAMQDRCACSTGCTFMATQRISDILSLFSVALIIEEEVDSNTLLMSPDMPENDLLTDPGLQKELLPEWWNSNGFKLPQTYIKTVPLDAGTVDYGIPSDYSGENEQLGSIPGGDWFYYAPRRIRIPLWLLAFLSAAIALSTIWHYLSPDKNNDVGKVTLIEKFEISPKVTVYMPDEAPLHKQPPPKYVDVVKETDNDMKV